MLSSAQVKSAAREAGFHMVGLARAEPLDPAPLRAWLESGMAGSMAWMHERVEKRLDPCEVLPGAKTVVALACCYLTESHDKTSPVALYAQGRDYHATMQDRLRKLRRLLRAIAPGVNDYAAVDTGALMEKVWAMKAGLGWLGKNALLLTREHGSHVVLSAMVLDAEVDTYDAPIRDLCGTCTACLTGCPTKAIVRPGVVDARLCLSYQTIENRTLPSEETRAHTAGVAFGCDICQRVCPWTRKEHHCDDPRFLPREIATLPVDALALLSPERFKELTQGTAVARAKYDGLRRNALFSMGAERHPRTREIATQLSADPNELVAEAARWALAQLASDGTTVP